MKRDEAGWIERNLKLLGLSMFVVGLVLTVLGSVVSFYYFVDPTAQPRGALGTVLMALATIGGNTGYTFLIVGLFAYGIGHLTRAAFLTIVGFEQTKSSEMLVKGPDADDVVWIGRKFDDALDAHAAAAALRKRFGLPKEESGT